MVSLNDINQAPADQSRWEPLQAWLEEHDEQRSLLHAQAFLINARDGTQVARHPSHDPTGERYQSLGENFNYRDYFHGLGQDAYNEKHLVRAPLERPHNGAVHESVNKGTLAVIFSVPIRANQAAVPIGVLGLAIDLGSFASLEMDLPPGQQVMLVDTRQYYLERMYPEQHRETGEGLVLHHRAMDDLREMVRLPHIDATVLKRLSDYKRQARAASGGQPLDNLLRKGFQDPLSGDEQAYHLAAFAPVIVATRPIEYNDTGWFLIVQQAE